MSRSRGFLVFGCVLVGFLLVISLRTRSADPEARLPERFRLAGLINREQDSIARLRSDADKLRAEVEAARGDAAGRKSGAAQLTGTLDRARLHAGVAAVKGPGMRVTLDDSDLKQSPTGNLNDLVIHSQDVQAVVNALWRAGAEAVAINGQRLVGTSAVLCVGNTLLLNGTVHSPPYEIAAIGAGRDKFEDDRLVRRLHDDADAFGLRFSIRTAGEVEVPGYDGATTLQYARPAVP
jgi:uncharacterized protein YlxW (UPF0749 family)